MCRLSAVRKPKLDVLNAYYLSTRAYCNKVAINFMVREGNHKHFPSSKTKCVTVTL